MRRVLLDRPFIGGMVTDLPAYKLAADQSSFAQDLLNVDDLATQRSGFTYDGSTNSSFVAHGVWRAVFVLADVTRTMLSGASSGSAGTIKIHASNFVQSAAQVSNPLPRAMYRDELFFCFPGGQTPMRRYSGAILETDAATADWVVNTATFVATSGTFTDAAPGWYLYLARSGFPYLSLRVLEKNSTTSLTIEDVRATVAAGSSTIVVRGTGECIPCVLVYNAGTVSIAANVVTGAGTKWATGDWGQVFTADSLLTLPSGGSAQLSTVNSVTDDDTLGCTVPNATNINYGVVRSPPFTDVAAHKGSLWGTGVAQYPDRVYVSPPGWNPSLPPGYVAPMDPTVAFTSPNPADYLLKSVDVPSPYDGDGNVAILSSSSPLLVLKRKGVYGIYGSYPSFELAPIADGAGCIDIRSAWNLSVGPVWAGESGIYLYTSSGPVDLTNGRINGEWRALTADFDYGVLDYCTIGETHGRLVVHITTGAGTTKRTYFYDLAGQAWTSRATNMNARFQFSGKVPGEPECLLAVSDDQAGRVMRYCAAINGDGLAKDADGTAPRMQAWTSAALAQSAGIDGESVMTDLVVEANVYDAGAAGTTAMALSVVHSGALDDGNVESTKTLTAIPSDSVDLVNRHEREVHRAGRLFQVQLDVSTLGTNTTATKIQVAQVTADFVDTVAGT